MRQSPAIALFVALACPLLAGQASPDRGKLVDELKSAYELTKMQFADPTKVRTAGAVYVVAADGVLASPVTAGTTGSITYVRAGKAGSTPDGGAGSALNSLLGRRPPNTRTLERGERVYVTEMRDTREGLVVGLLTVGTRESGAARRDAQYEATIVFQSGGRRFPDAATAADLKRVVDAYLVSEAEASAPKRLALGQTREEVEKAMGKPKTIVDLGSKTIYTYPDP